MVVVRLVVLVPIITGLDAVEVAWFTWTVLVMPPVCLAVTHEYGGGGRYGGEGVGGINYVHDPRGTGTEAIIHIP